MVLTFQNLCQRQWENYFWQMELLRFARVELSEPLSPGASDIACLLVRDYLKHSHSALLMLCKWIPQLLLFLAKMLHVKFNQVFRSNFQIMRNTEEKWKAKAKKKKKIIKHRKWKGNPPKPGCQLLSRRFACAIWKALLPAQLIIYWSKHTCFRDAKSLLALREAWDPTDTFQWACAELMTSGNMQNAQPCRTRTALIIYTQFLTEASPHTSNPRFHFLWASTPQWAWFSSHTRPAPGTFDNG